MSTYALAQESSDAFAQILEDLNDIASQIRQISIPLNSLRDVIHESNQVIGKVEQLFIVVDDVCVVMEVTQKASCLLSGVPIVGEIADVVAHVLAEAAKIAKSIKNDLHPIREQLPKVKEFFQKADNFTSNICEALNTTAQKIPEYVHTIAILNCIFKIAKPMTSLFQGNDAVSALSKFVKEYEKIRDLISLKLLPVVAGIDELVKTVNKFENNLNNMGRVGTSLDQSISGISSVTDELNRITKALHTVEEAIDPVKWALKAAHDVEKVVNPLVSKALKATGLEHMVDSLKKQVFGNLQLTELIHQIEEVLQSELLQQTRGSADGKVPDFASVWNELDTVLSRHSTSANGSGKTLIQELLSEIAGTPIDFAKPGVIRDWSD